jgi:hypothetical protein
MGLSQLQLRIAVTGILAVAEQEGPDRADAHGGSRLQPTSVPGPASRPDETSAGVQHTLTVSV